MEPGEGAPLIRTTLGLVLETKHMGVRLIDLSLEETEAMPIDRLGLLVLEHLAATNEWNEHNFLNHGANRGVGERALRCWAEALNWLIAKGLVARGTPGQSSAQTIFITRVGRRAIAEGMQFIVAAARLDVALHGLLIKVHSQFLIGEYEIAAFAAMREVEIRVRHLSGADSSLIGVKLMRKAFGEGGTLADPTLDPGERVGLMELFAGAIGTFKNPPSHRQVDYANPTEASEVVLLADLLMRVLDRYDRGGVPCNSSDGA
jgi:uncharacterized protein (TIGR02391 family)